MIRRKKEVIGRLNDTSVSKHAPQGPQGKLITGHLKEFQTDPLEFLNRLAEEYGEVAKIRFGPFQNVYFVSDPEMIKQILVTKQKHFIKSREFKVLEPVLGEGLLTSERDFHMHQRRLIQPAFKRSHIVNYGQDMIDLTADYISTWQDGDERLITQDMMNLTLGIICKTMFDLNFKEGYEIIGGAIESAMRTAVKRMRSIIPLPLWIPTKSNREFKKAIQALDKVIYNIIEKRRNSPEKREDMLGILMDAKDDHDIGMSDKQVHDEVMTIFLAGHETTANALSWTFYLLSQHPEIEHKLLEEIQTVIGNRQPEPGDFMKLSYAQNVIWESMRLFPPAFITGREVDEKVEINGYQFHKGDMILLSQYVVHRKSEYFCDPHSFIPERFENDFLKKIPPFAYFPFGGGPRVCIGNHFALMEAVLVLVTIAQRYKWRLASDHHEIKPLPSITLRPKRGLRMIIEERDSFCDLPGMKEN